MCELQWNIPQRDPVVPEALLQAGCTPLLAAVLHARGVRGAAEAAAFLEVGGDALADPLLLTDMDRAAGYLSESAGQIQMAANLYLLSPGSPFLYYGEEIGLKGSRGGANSDANRRLAMRWGDGDTVRDPEETTYDLANQTKNTAADAMASEGSLYSYYKRLLLLRKAHPEIAHGSYEALSLTDTKAGGFVCALEGRKTLVLHNTGKKAVTLTLSEIGLARFEQVSAFIGLGEARLEDGVLTLDAQTTALFTIEQ